MLYAPLEQFQILSLINIKILNLDFSFTNFLLINLLSLISFIGFIYYNSASNSEETYFYFISNAWQKFVNSISELTLQLVSDIILADNKEYFHFNFIKFYII